VLFTIPLLFYSFASHAAYQGSLALAMGIGATAFAFVLSAILTYARAFVNRSSLAQTYAARLARAYLGASNPLRHRPEGSNITEVVAGDDVPSMRDYKPYNVGGPLHLINVTVNQTIDFTSQRGNRDRKGENLAVSGIGISVGKTWHSMWADPVVDRADARPSRNKVRLEPLGHMRGTDHPLIDETGAPANLAEMLSLRRWMGISGAAVAPGRGQTTRLGTALLYGLANLRTGYWWDSGISEVARDGYPKLTLFRRLFYVLQRFFLTQSMLIAEWTARYPGPWERFWYISDGGFFDNSGAYELIRRRVPRIILCDGSADPKYEFEDFANFVRKARIDFDAEITAFDLTSDAAAAIPTEVAPYLGTLEDLGPRKDQAGNIVGPSTRHAALFWIRYSTSPLRMSLLLYVKSSVTGDETADIQQYYRARPEFPHEGTSDQFFDEAQWESYRRLGEHIALPLAAHGKWFWHIPLGRSEP